MGEVSIFEKIRARKRMLEAVGSEPVRAVAPAPAVKPSGATKRVMTRDPATNKIVWIEVPDV